MTKDMFKRHSKLVMLLLLVFLLLFGISACGQKDKKKDTEKKENKTETVEDTNTLPDEKRLLKDIQNGENIVYLSKMTCELETKSVKIDKAKKEEDQYFVYCTAEQENDMFSANNHYVMTYTFYDIGGWILEDCYIEFADMIPKKSMPEEEIKTYIQNTHGSMALQRIEEKKVSDVEYTYQYDGKIEYNYMVESYNIEVRCMFDNEVGWHIFSNVNSVNRDWSKMYGVWYGEDNSKTFKVTVKEVNNSALTFKCDIHIVKKETGKNVYDFKDVTGSLLVEDWEPRQEEGIEYYSELKGTYISEITNNEYTWNATLYWGKNVGMSRLYIDGWYPSLAKMNQ